MNIPTHTLNVIKSFNCMYDQYNLQVSNYIFQLLYFKIHEEIESNLVANNQIHAIIQGPITK